MKKIQEQIKNRDFAKVYLLYGEEEYLKRYYKKQLVQAVLKDTDQMNYSAYEGKGISFREVIDVAETIFLKCQILLCLYLWSLRWIREESCLRG